MKLSITRAALVAHVLLGHAIAATVITTPHHRQLQTVEQDASLLDNTNIGQDPKARLHSVHAQQQQRRQVPVSSNNDLPHDTAPGGATVPRDMQQKPNDNSPQPVPVMPGSGSGQMPKTPMPVKNPGPVKPPIAGRAVRRPRSYSAAPAPALPLRNLRQRNAQVLPQRQQQTPKEAQQPPPQSPPLPLPPHSGPPGNNDNDPVLPIIIPQPKIPGVPQPRVPVPVETDRPAPKATSRS